MAEMAAIASRQGRVGTGRQVPSFLPRLKRLLQDAAERVGFFVARYNPAYIYSPAPYVWRPLQPLDSAKEDLFFELARSVIESGNTLLSYDRLYILWQAVCNVTRLHLPGVEVGSFRGGSAYFIAGAFKVLHGRELPLYVFDTFEGHPDKALPGLDPVHAAGMFSETSYEAVKRYLSPFSNTFLYKGEFSDTVKSLPNLIFGLVHIDVDIYQSTLDCLEYFAPRLAIGGVIVVDDYGAPKCPGVDRAVQEFLSACDQDFQAWHMRTEQLVLVKTH